MVDEHGRCQTAGFNIMLRTASLRTTTVFAPPHLPPTEHPRLLGADPEWLAKFVDPFVEMACDVNAGPSDWGGVLSFKHHFQTTLFGWCTGYGRGCRSLFYTGMHKRTCGSGD